MSFIVVGMSHHDTPEEIRKKYAVSRATIEHFLQSVQNRKLSLIILSTCNRLEIYTEHLAVNEAKELWSSFLTFCQCPSIPPTYTICNQQSIEHVFKVCLGLDSKVLREHQIIGQMRKALLWSSQNCALDFGLRRLFERAFQLSKSLRASWVRCSLGSLAAQYLSVIAHDRPILIIGAGDIIKDFISHSDSFGKSKLTLCNRTYENALIASKHSPTPIAIRPFTQIFSEISKHSIIVLGISTPDPLINSTHFSPTEYYDILDFGIPSALSNDIKQLPNVTLKSLDSFTTDTIDSYEEYSIWLKIQEYIVLFEQDLQIYRNRHLVVKYRKTMESECNLLTQKAIQSYARGTDPALLLQSLAYKIQQKLLHWPSIAFKQSMVESHHLDSFCHSSDAISLPPIKSFESV